jgi:hypothetical protein
VGPLALRLLRQEIPEGGGRLPVGLIVEMGSAQPEQRTSSPLLVEGAGE